MRYGDTVGEFEYTFWRDEDWYLGYLNEYPEYWTARLFKARPRGTFERLIMGSGVRGYGLPLCEQ